MSGLRIAPLVPYEEAVAKIPPGDFIDIDGQRVYARVRGEGPVVVLLHGLVASSFSWRKVIDQLEASFRVVAIDLNGFGYTERPTRWEKYQLEEQGRDILRIVDRIGGETFSVVGHSYGCAVALHVAAQAPERVTRLVLTAPASEFGMVPWWLRNPITQRAVYWLCRGLLSRPEKFRELSMRAVYRKEVLTVEASRFYLDQILVEGLRESFFGFLRAASGEDSFRLPTSAVAAETLIVAGEKDELVSVGSCQRLGAELSDSRLEIMVETGHSGPEECPEQYLAIVMPFLQNGAL